VPIPGSISATTELPMRTTVINILSPGPASQECTAIDDIYLELVSKQKAICRGTSDPTSNGSTKHYSTVSPCMLRPSRQFLLELADADSLGQGNVSSRRAFAVKRLENGPILCLAHNLEKANHGRASKMTKTEMINWSAKQLYGGPSPVTFHHRQHLQLSHLPGYLAGSWKQ
jgi:hypothetical protein